MENAVSDNAALTVESESADHLPFSLLLELTVKDPDTIAELCKYPDGEEREQFAQRALRIGVLALKQARGEIDAGQIRRESERLLESLQGRLSQHAGLVQERLASLLKDYFDPESGRFQERVDRLVKKDGELESLLRRQIGVEDSELCRTLTAHIGENSPLLKQLDPEESHGLLGTLRETLDEQLRSQREQVLNQFSLDNKDGALSRFIAELTERQGELSEDLQTKIEGVVKQFSLDDENSALSRLVDNVRVAQRRITSEFSLDDETSALSRLKKLLDHTNEAIHGHLSLDDDTSALSRLKRELLTLLTEHRETNQKFQQEVRVALESMAARKKESERSTRHGEDFEMLVFEQTQNEAQKLRDVATHTGATTGRIKNCKVGDCVIELGPESAAPGALIVIEAKAKKEYDLKRARDEIETARKNRGAHVGLFVFCKKTAPDGIDDLARYGNDVFVVWDPETPDSDLYLRVGFTLARALCVRHGQAQSAHTEDLTDMDKAILEIEKRVKALDNMEKWTTTIQSNADKVLQSLGTTRKSLERQVDILREKMSSLRATIQDDGPATE